MKLIYRITIRVSIALTLVLTVWAVFFYITMINEVNDETDDSLEEYSETIIRRALMNEELPSKDNGSNNCYFLKDIDENYAAAHQQIRYIDTVMYILSKEETEPARVLVTVFRNNDNKFYELTVFTPTIDKDDLKKSILLWIVILYTVLLLILIALNIWLAYFTMRPLYVLLRWLNNYRLGMQNESLNNDTNVVEFKKLNAAAVSFTQRSKELFEQQKEFIGNASHEIQTPIAICQNRLEMLAQDSTLSEKNLVEIFKTLQTLEQISKLNKSLLLLTKIDNGQFPDTESVCLNTSIKPVLDDFIEIYSFKNINVEFIENADFICEMNESLAHILVTNLIKNAFVHTEKDSALKIIVDRNQITFANTGNRPLDAVHIFDRFYHEMKKENSTGLGLAISQSICRLYKLEIFYQFKDCFHLFEIKR